MLACARCAPAAHMDTSLPLFAVLSLVEALDTARQMELEASIQQLDRAGALRRGKIQHGLRQDTKGDSRTDRIGFLPQILSEESAAEERAKARARQAAKERADAAMAAALGRARSEASGDGGSNGSDSGGGRRVEKDETSDTDVPSDGGHKREEKDLAIGRATERATKAAASAAKAGTTTVPIELCSESLKAYSLGIDAIREALNEQSSLIETLQGSLDGCNLMCAVYPGAGAFYVKHRDALPYKAGRKLTVIYYLNEHWQPGHGGELRIWPRDGAPASLKHDISDAGSTDAEPPPVIVEPLADRLLLFISSLEHEVLPAWRPRYALTTWMYNRRDTALEAWAEEMREKKASGKLNTKAILAALDADSSSESDDNSDGKGGGDQIGNDENGGRGKQGVRRESAMSVMLALLKRKQAKESAAMQRLDDASAA